MTVLSSFHPKYRTKLCRNIANGSCPYGQKCSFLHPATPIHPFLSSLARYLMSWNNAFLPQHIAMSNQQPAVNQTQRQHPPSGVPEFVDEDQSPTPSLLLSVSPSQYPVGEQSTFQQNVAASHFGAAYEEQVSPSESTDDLMDQARSISSGVLMSMPSQPPSVTGQMYVGSAEQMEPEQAQLAPLLQQDILNAAIRSDLTGQPPTYRSGYLLQPYSSYYPVISGPVTSTMPISPASIADYPVYQPTQVTVQDDVASPAPYFAAVPVRDSVPVSAPISIIDHNIYPPMQNTVPDSIAPPASYYATVPPSTIPLSAPISNADHNAYQPVQALHNDVILPAETERAFPAGMYQAHYLLRQIPPISIVYPIPVPTTPYAHPMAIYPCYPVASPLPPSRHDMFSSLAMNALPPSQTHFAPYPMTFVPQLEDLRIPLSSAPSGWMFAGNTGSTRVADQLQVATQDQPVLQPFPYNPPRDRQVGHARRISVDVKKRAHGRSG